ncbi:MAG TPA: hypothetical protein VN914_09960 [Polyangia bacterium]|nr:hypothetical protein [Polyangia bacterium]
MSCAEPISWLRLERKALGEISGAEGASIDQHLAGCATCREAAASLQRSLRLAPLPVMEERARLRPPAWRWLVGATAAAAAVTVFLARPSPPSIKGSDITLTLVREHDGDTDLDPAFFAPGDRFKLLVTCPPQFRFPWDVVVFQDGQVRSFPYSKRGRLSCGNQVPLFGGMRLTGTTPVTICFLWAPNYDRDTLSRKGEAGLPPRARCEKVSPAP